MNEVLTARGKSAKYHTLRLYDIIRWPITHWHQVRDKMQQEEICCCRFHATTTAGPSTGSSVIQQGAPVNWPQLGLIHLALNGTTAFK